MQAMKRLVAFVFSFILLSGCVPVLIGAGVVTGYALSGDSAIGNVKAEYRILWDLSLDKLESMEAELLDSDESRGLIKARVAENDVTIRIKNINFETQRLKVSARKYLLPKPQFAQKLFLQIIEDL